MDMEYQRDYQYPPLKKYVYVKQHIVDSIKSGQSKVLINPNFMKPPVVHVNPHFKPNVKIHVNPNVIKPPTVLKATEVTTSAPKQIDLPSEKVSLPLTKPVITRNKVVRVRAISTTRKSVKALVKSKYKLNNTTATLQKQRFKIDNRPGTNKVISNKVKRLINLPNKNIYVKCNKKLVSNCSTLSQRHLINNTICVKKARRLITIGNEKYQLGANKRSLTILSNKERVSSSKTFSLINIKPSLYVKNNVRKRSFLSQTKHKTTNILKNKLKKSNVPCPFYRKFGKCKGKETGTCIRIHNADQISLCPRFLQGICLNQKCLLSHKVSAEKMPTCKFYLDGLCSKDDCPYLHVKINSKAEVCKDFLGGFCKIGAECDKRHQYLCPDFEQKGKCEKKKCPYPHKTVVRNIPVLKNVPPKLQTIKTSKFKRSSNNIKETPEKLASLRYYNGSLRTTALPEVQMQMDNTDKLESENNETTSNTESITKRPTVGELPSFIPFILNADSS